MGDEDTRTAGDVRAVLGLLAPLAAEASEARAKLVRGLARELGADVYWWAQGVDARPGGLPMPFRMIEGGWRDGRQRGLMVQAFTDRDKPHVPSVRLLERLRRGHGVWRRSELVDDAAWYGSANYRAYYQPAGLDHSMVSFRLLDRSGVYTSLCLHRSAGRPPFSDAQRDMLREVAEGVAWLHQADGPGGAADATASLTPRLRQVLLLLLAGQSRRQIADKLNLSVHTVGDYTKALHKHFNVRTRAELMARFLGGGDPNAAD